MTKRALAIGINYVGTSAQLAGCINDANDWAEALEARGFDSIYTVLDAEATRGAMLIQMEDLVKQTGPDDLAVITYSGHGSWQPDRSGDEPDRRDEVLCPVDYARSGMLSDDDLYRVFTAGHRWARVVFISDSCHSGSVNRLAGPLNIEPVRRVDRPDMEPVDIPLAWRRAKFLPPAAWMPEDQVDVARRVELVPSRGRPRASALLLAACTDTQVAYDAWFRDKDGQLRANGAFTYAALQALAEDPATYRDWQRGINRRLPSVDYMQSPRLEGGSGQRRWLVFEESGER